MPLEETVTELRKELEQCLINNKAKRDQVFNLETELNTVKSQLKQQESKAQRMEVIAQEHEVGYSNTSVHRCVKLTKKKENIKIRLMIIFCPVHQLTSTG